MCVEAVIWHLLNSRQFFQAKRIASKCTKLMPTVHPAYAQVTETSAAVIPDLPKDAIVMDQITPNFFLIAIIPVVA